MEDKLLGTFKILKAIQKDQLFAQIGQNFNLDWGSKQKSSKINFSPQIQNPITEMDVQLHFNIEKRIQRDFGQNCFPNHVCGEPEVFTPYGNFHFLPAKWPKMVFQLFFTNS